MLEKLILNVTENSSRLNNIDELLNEIKLPSKTILIKEGDIIRNIYFVKKGCLRLWFNNNGKDITYQFFFENQPVSGFLDDETSMFYLETIEPSSVVILKKKDFEFLLKEIPELRDDFLEYLLQRLSNYSRLFLSRIKDSPQKRYMDLLKNNPGILRRVPQKHIASYLGITAVSLSRIRNRKDEG
jgi:CRP-like cAMP-binding protein